MSRNTMLNESLAAKQNVTEKQRENLYGLYEKIKDMIDEANAQEVHDPETCHAYAAQMKEYEFELQKNWNFELSELHHTWWNRFKGCQCPRMDNDERFGHEKIIVMSCPYHGNI